MTVEINTIFQQLVSVLSQIEPAKLNQTLGATPRASTARATSSASRWRTLTPRSPLLNPSLDTLNHEIAVAPTVFDAYSSAAPDLVKTVDNATKISDTIVDQNDNLDALLVSAIGWPTSGPRCFHQPAAADRRAAPAGAHHGSAERVSRGAVIAALPACFRSPPGWYPLPGCDPAAILLPRPRALPLSPGSAEGGRHGWTTVHRPAQGPVRATRTVRGGRHRHQPGPVRQPGHPAEL